MYPYSSAETITVTSGTPYVLEIKAPLNGLLNMLVVKQRGGTLAGFTVDVYSDKKAAGGTDDLEQNSEVATTISPEVFKVTPTLTVAAAAAITENYEKRWGYKGNNVSKGKTNKGLWMVIAAAGTGDKVFDIGLCVLTPELS